MKAFILLISLGILSSCSSSQERKSLSQRIEAEEVRSLREIKSHAEYLLASHPELDEATKNEISALLDSTIAKQVELKNEESKIFQLLLSKALKVNQLNENEIKDKNNLKIRMKNIHKEKSKNILSLISKMVSLSTQNSINEGFRHDIVDFMRDFR